MVQSSFEEFPPEAFPLTIELWAQGRDHSGAPSWSSVVPEPGIVKIPVLGAQTWVRITYGDGQIDIMSGTQSQGRGEQF